MPGFLISAMFWWGIAVAVFGAGVGASELVARYRDAPFSALVGPAAGWYVLANSAAAVLAYALIRTYGLEFGAAAGQAGLVQALVAGFGSMAFFRSSLFTMRVGDTDVAVGPGLFFQVLLFATDRAVDRGRAGPRAREIGEIMRGVSFEQAREALPNFCFELMQNVPQTEQQEVRQAIDRLASPKTVMRDSVKVLNLGLMLANVVGYPVLQAAVRTLGERIQGPAALELAVFLKLQSVDFAKAYPLLVDVCFIMSRYGSQEEQTKAKAAVLAEIDAIKDDTTLDNATKATMLGLSLQQRVGDAVLLAAIAQFEGSIQRQDTAEQPPKAAAGGGGGSSTVVPLRSDPPPPSG